MNSRQNSANAFATRNPQYNSSLTASLTQPLLRGFRTDSTRTALLTDRLSQSNDEIALQSTIATTVANTRNAYWDLVFAIQAVAVAQQSLDLSSKLVQDNQARVHQIMANYPLVKVEQVYRYVFERILNERVSTAPVVQN